MLKYEMKTLVLDVRVRDRVSASANDPETQVEFPRFLMKVS
jgi:hypothetical protein